MRGHFLPVRFARIDGPLLPCRLQPAPPVPSDDILSQADKWECATCGHEWAKEAVPESARVVKDAHGHVLADGGQVKGHV